LLDFACGSGGASPASSFAGGNIITYDYYNNQYINADGEEVSSEQGLNYLYSGTTVIASFSGRSASSLYAYLKDGLNFIV
jgi:hypothetical protein